MKKRTDQLENLILELLLAEGQITRSRILKAYPMRPATLLAVINDMTRRGFLHEPQRTGRRTGARASVIELNPRSGYFIGLELDYDSAATTIGVCMDAQGKIIHEQRLVAPAPMDQAAGQAQVAALLANLRQQLGPDWALVRGVGFTDNGLGEPRRKSSMVDWLTELSGLPVQYISQPLMRAYAEFISSGIDRPRCLINIFFDSGISAGFVDEGRLFRGAGDCALEIGHFVAQENGPLCRCGNRGCLERVVGKAAILRQLAEMKRQQVICPLTREPFSIELWKHGLLAGDKVARNLLTETGQSVGRVVAALVGILNPEVIVFSGAMSGLGSPLLDQIRQMCSQLCLPQAVAQLELRISKLDDTGTAWGGALLARRQALRPPGGSVPPG